jgi:hypothetical protein
MYMEVSPDGDFLYVTDLSIGVRGYEIASDGTLTELSGSPFTYPSMSRASQIELTADGTRLFLLDFDLGIVTFDVEDSGALDPVADSPFAVGSFSYLFDLTVDDHYLYAYVEDRIHGFEVLPDGTLWELSASPFAEGSWGWMLLDPPETPLLYAGNMSGWGIRTFSIAGDGAIGQVGSDVPVGDDLERVPNGAVYYRPAGGGDVRIDIKPDSEVNPINPRSHGVTPVALLGSEDFDVTEIDPTSLRFGPNEAPPAHDLSDGWPHGDALNDVDGDGFVDLLAHFSTQETGIVCGDTEATLTGEALDGSSFQGTDSIRTVGCSHRAKSRRGKVWMHFMGGLRSRID